MPCRRLDLRRRRRLLVLAALILVSLAAGPATLGAAAAPAPAGNASTLAREMPEAYTPNSVGTTMVLEAGTPA